MSRYTTPAQRMPKMSDTEFREALALFCKPGPVFDEVCRMMNVAPATRPLSSLTESEALEVARIISKPHSLIRPFDGEGFTAHKVDYGAPDGEWWEIYGSHTPPHPMMSRENGNQISVCCYAFCVVVRYNRRAVSVVPSAVVRAADYLRAQGIHIELD